MLRFRVQSCRIWTEKTRLVLQCIWGHTAIQARREHFHRRILDRWHKLFTCCIRRYLVSRACDWVRPALSAVLLIFSFQFSLLFFHVGRQASAAAYVVYPVSDIGRYRKCGMYVPCTERTDQGKDFELILTVKIETSHPVGGTFGSEFPAICNNCVVMAAWSRKTWNFCEQFLLFLEKSPVKILCQKFTWRHRSMLLVSNVVKFLPTGNR